MSDIADLVDFVKLHPKDVVCVCDVDVTLTMNLEPTMTHKGAARERLNYSECF